MPDIPDGASSGAASDESASLAATGDDPDGTADSGADLKRSNPPPSAEPVRGGWFARLFPHSPLWRFLAYVRPHLWLVAGGALMGVLKFTLPLLFPLGFKYVIDVLLSPTPKLDRMNTLINGWCVWLAALMHLGEGATGKLEALTIALFAIFVLQAIATYFRNYWASMAGHRLIFDLRYALFLHMQRLSHSFFDRNASGGIVSRFISDIASAQNFVGSGMINTWMDAASLGAVLYLMLKLDVRLAWISLVIVPLYVAVIRLLAPRIKEASHDLQETVEEFSGELHERVAGVATVKSFAREKEEARRFYDRTSELYDLTIRNVRLASTHQMFGEFIGRTAPLIVICAGAIFILHNRMTVGTMVAFFGLLGSLYLPLQRYSELSIIVATSLAAIERIFRFFDETPEVKDKPNAKTLTVRRGDVLIDHLSFAYQPYEGGAARTVLHDINLTVAAGTTVALVGRSGAGKTTLASLLPRFYEPSAGKIEIDGVNIANTTLKSLRDSIGIVPQDAVLFSSTIRENVLYGRPAATDADVWRALDQANIRAFVEALPQKLDTMIGEGGVRPSTGQRQRLALARVFLKNPPILILDEATSGLDSEVENLIHDAVRRLMKGRTSFFIAHRLASAVDADVIVVLDKGRLCEMGSHAELLGLSGVYARLFNEQVRTLRPDFHVAHRVNALSLAERG